MRAPSLTSSAKYLVPLLLASAVAYAGYVSAWAGRSIAADHPMEYRENAALLTSALQLQGKNPYSLEERPLHVNLFGCGYYWVSYPFARCFGNSYQTLRGVSAAFVLAGCALLVWGLRFDGCPWWAALSGGMLLLSQLGQGLSVTARPDGLGVCLFLASLVIPYCGRFGPASLVVSAALSILGYLTKPYCVLGLPLVCFYVFLSEGKLKGCIFGVAGGLALLLVLAAVNAVYECYLTETLIAQHNMVRHNSEHLMRVGGAFLKDRIGFLAVLAGGVLVWISSGGSRAGRLSFPLFVLVCNGAVMALFLGSNPGNDVLYYHHLISPFLIWVVMVLASQQSRWQGVVLLLLLGNILWLGFHRPRWPEDSSAAWANLDRLVSSQQRIFAAPHLSHLLMRHGLPVYDSGQTEYAPYAFQRNPTRVSREYEQRTRAFFRDIRDKVVNEEFDLILVCRGWARLVPRQHLQAHYVCKCQLPAPMAFDYWMDEHPLELWVPRSRPSVSEGANGPRGAPGDAP